MQLDVKDIKGKKTNVKTVQGSDLAVDATDGVKINEATVVTADVNLTAFAANVLLMTAGFVLVGYQLSGLAIA